MFQNFVKTFLQKKSVRISLAFLAVCWALVAVVFYIFYQAAYAHLLNNDPRIMQNRSELSVYYSPLKVAVGDVISVTELTDYLVELGYENRPDETAGSYFVEKNELRLSPRSKIFQAAVLTINKNRIGKIMIDKQTVNRLEIEPLPMRSFIKFVNDDSLKSQRIRRIVISPDAIPTILADATKAAEDSRFDAHGGIDVFGIIYRVVTLRGGGSSLTQQVIKNNVIKGSSEEFWQTYLGFLPEKIQRKIMEIPFAIAAEELMSKEEIMATYLSLTPLGASEGVELHGAFTASQEYFGKTLSELTLAESATLAGMIHKPSYYVGLAKNNDYERLADRRNRILDLIRRNNPEKYAESDIKKSKNEPLKFIFASANRTERPADAYSRLFSAYVANHLPENLSEMRETESSLQIFTTLDYRLQKNATEISERAINDLTPKIQTECLRQKPTNVDCNTVKPQVSLVAIQAETGEILAMYGGNSLDFNFATARRSPASSIKPFYYLLALEKGIWNGKPFTPETEINPETDTVSFRPKSNIGIKSTASLGLAKSYNFHAVAAAESVGIETATNFVGKLTNSNPEKSGMSAIGGSKESETSLLDMVSAYSVFANQGVLVKATPNLLYIKNEKRFTFAKVKPERIATIDSAVKTNEMMKLVLTPNGTAPNFKKEANLLNNNSLSAKTGSGMVADLWFFAVSPKLIVGVWVGLPNNEIDLDMDRNFSGGKIASPIAAKFFKAIQNSNANYIE